MKITIKNKKIKKISAIIFDKVINSLTPNFVAPTPDKKVKEKVLPIVLSLPLTQDGTTQVT